MEISSGFILIGDALQSLVFFRCANGPGTPEIPRSMYPETWEKILEALHEGRVQSWSRSFNGVLPIAKEAWVREDRNLSADFSFTGLKSDYNYWPSPGRVLYFLNDAGGKGSITGKVFVKEEQILALDNPPARRSVGGRPSKYDWEGAIIGVIAFIHFNGIPEKKSEITEYLVAWFRDKDGDIPAESEIRKRASAIHDELVKLK